MLIGRCLLRPGSGAMLAATFFVVASSPTPSRAQIQSGLIGYWKLDGNYTDLSPGHRHLTAAGGIGFDAGIKGQAAAFPGNSGQWLQRPSDDEVYDFGSGDFTIVLWVRFDGTADNQIFVEKWVGPSGPGWTFAKHPDNSIIFNASGPGALVSPVITLTPGVWYQFAVVRTGSSIEMYRDNQLIASEYGTYTGGIDNVAKPLLLGLRDGPAFPLDGRLDEVAIWSRALTSAELADLYSAHQMICNCSTQPSGFAAGDGTPENPYQVCSPLQLDNVRNNLSASYVQTADIDMSGRDFEPIGDGFSRFLGTYHGWNLTISHLTIDKTSDVGGLFGWTGGTGELHFINLVSASISANTIVGGLIGYNEGLIEDCIVEAVIAGADRVGGFVGVNHGTIRRSS